MIDLLSGLQKNLMLDFIWLKLTVAIPFLRLPIIGWIAEALFDKYFGPIVHDLLAIFNFQLIDWEKAKANASYAGVLDKIKQIELSGEEPSDEKIKSVRSEFRKALGDVVNVYIPVRGNV